MKKVYQRISDKGRGDCMQCVMATLFGDEYEDVPAFIEYLNWWELMVEYALTKGYEYVGMLHNRNWNILLNPTVECKEDMNFHKDMLLNKENLAKREGINGLFFATVLSPKYFTWREQNCHAVIIDKDLNIVFDPQKEYQNIKAYPLTSILGNNGVIDIIDFGKIGSQ